MTDVATWSQLLSSIAVIGTLIYLVVEIRQNTAAEHAATRLAMQRESRDDFQTLIDHPDVGLCVAKAEPLLPDETVRLNAFLRSFAFHMEYVWRQHKAGAAEQGAWQSQVRAIRAAFTNKRSQRWWQMLGRQMAEPSFVEVVDAIIKDQPYTTYFEQLQAWGSEDLRG
jgi:hypothetical protein